MDENQLKSGVHQILPRRFQDNPIRLDVFSQAHRKGALPLQQGLQLGELWSAPYERQGGQDPFRRNRQETVPCGASICFLNAFQSVFPNAMATSNRSAVRPEASSHSR